jgi:hypothetical protein
VFGLPEMRARLHINLSQQGNLFQILYLGIFCSSLIVGPPSAVPRYVPKITDNAIIPLKERVVDRFFDPLSKLFRVFANRKT